MSSRGPLQGQARPGHLRPAAQAQPSPPSTGTVRRVPATVRTSITRPSTTTARVQVTNRVSVTRPARRGVTINVTGRNQPTTNISVRPPNRENTLLFAPQRTESPPVRNLTQHSDNNRNKAPRRSARLAEHSIPSANAAKVLNLSASIVGESVVFCPICMENIKQVSRQIMATSCGHLFCHDCLLTHFTKNRACPICLRNLILAEFREIFV